MSVSTKQQLKTRGFCNNTFLDCVVQQQGGHIEHLM